MAEREGLGRQGRDKEVGSERQTRGGRERRQTRHARHKGDRAGLDTGRAQAHAEGGALGGEKRQTGATHRPQMDYILMTRIEPYRPPRPSIRELMEGRPAGADDGGMPSKGYLGRPPKLAYRMENRAQAERLVWAREIQPWRGEEQRGAHRAGEEQ